VTGEAILSAENSGKASAGRRFAANPGEGAYSAPNTPRCPSPKTPPLLLSFGLDIRHFGPQPVGSQLSQQEILATPLLLHSGVISSPLVKCCILNITCIVLQSYKHETVISLDNKFLK